MRTSLISKNSREFCDRNYSSYLVHEHLIFSDMHFLGHANQESSPYQAINLIAGVGSMQAAALLRIRWATRGHSDQVNRASPTSETTGYTGMEPCHELGALISLILGCRIRISPMTRSYKPNGDPAGLDVRHYNAPAPPMPFEWQTLIVPWTKSNRTINLSDLNQLQNLHLIEDGQLVEVVKAAKLFSDALWVCESDPQLAWVLLVSSLEAAANSEIKTDKIRSLEAFEKFYVDHAGLLRAKLELEEYNKLANEFGKTQKAKLKFLRFCQKFHPAPPKDEQRPPCGRVDWTEAGWEKILNIVYGYRSGYLHSGEPIPFPLLQAPLSVSVDETDNRPAHQVPTEQFAAISAQWLQAHFVADDLPVYLNCFAEYVHGVLNRWLSSHLC